MRYVWPYRQAMSTSRGPTQHLSLAERARCGDERGADRRPSSDNDWERGALNSGVIETEDLGELQTGLLRSDHGGPISNWKVEWIRSSTKKTVASGPRASASGATGPTPNRACPKFTRTSDGQYEQIQRRKAEAAQKAAEDQATARQGEGEAEQEKAQGGEKKTASRRARDVR